MANKYETRRLLEKTMERKEVLNSPEYWTAKTQVDLYSQAQKYMEKTGKNKSQLAEYLGVSKGYVSQLLNGDYDHRLSKFFELALAFGVVPQIDFIPIEDYVKEDMQRSQFKNVSIEKEKEYSWTATANSLTKPATCKDLTSCITVFDLPKKSA